MQDRCATAKSLENILTFIQNGIISGMKGKGASKVKFETIRLKDKTCVQFSYFQDNKVTHENIPQEEALEKIFDIMETGFKQANINGNKSLTLLRSKKNMYTVTGVKDNINISSPREHNKKPNYIIDTSSNTDWLYKLGITDKDGVVLSHKQKKFRQINKFVEMLSDVEEHIPSNSVIVDMGCGKSYLTFAMYHYFNIMKNKNITFRGYDLKKDVVEECNNIAKMLGYDNNLKFYNEDIALYHGIRWGCKVIMSVPCCQHELFGKIKNDDMDILLKHGIFKERFSALLTDSIRAEMLDICGYKVQVLEFIDMEHTPKNIMIRAVKRSKNTDTTDKIQKLDRYVASFNAQQQYLYRKLKQEN